MGGIPHRLFQCVYSLLSALDIALQVVLKIIPWVFFGRARPAQMTISATCGQAASLGYKWGVIAAKVIDGLFGKGHCEDAWLTYKSHFKPFDL